MNDIDTSEKELPLTWKWSTMGTVANNFDAIRVPVKKDDRKNMQGIYPYYGASGIIDYVDDYLFDGEYVLIGEDGANLLARSKPLAFKASGQFWVNNHAHILKTFGKIPLSYIEHYINSIDIKMYVTGTAQPKLTQVSLNKIPVPVAPLPEQHRIVTKIEELFSRLDAGVDALEKVWAQLKLYRQSVLKAAVEGRLTAEWREKHKSELEPASKLLKRILTERRKKWEEDQLAQFKAKGKVPKDDKWKKKYKEPELPYTSDLPELPEGWCWAKVSHVSLLSQYGTSEKATADESGIPVLRMGNIQDGVLVYDKLKYFPSDWENINEFKLVDGDVLFNRTNSAELVGKTAVYKEKFPKSVFASYLIRVKTNGSYYNPDFLSYYINSFHGRSYIGSVVTQQVGQANVNGTKLSNMPIPILTLEEQNRIVHEVEHRFSIADKVEEAITLNLLKSDRLRQSTLKKAFSGKLVPQDPTDEPAEKLLERIKAEKEKNKPVKKTRKKKAKRKYP